VTLYQLVCVKFEVMVQDLIVIHKKGGGLDGLEEPWVLWKTCLRQIAFGLRDYPVTTDIEAEIYRGEAAYIFALEVVCGLKSPLAGETEVMGQFRDLLAKLEVCAPALKKILDQVLADSKTIRHKHLSKLGSQSYGSLSRKFLAEFKSLHILGAGQLTEELLPWFSDKATVFVHGRQIEKRKKLSRDFQYVQLAALDRQAGQPGPTDSADGTALIVAAPMKAADIVKWVGQRQFTKILDLRGESRTDPITGLQGVVSLKDFYQNLESHQAQIREKVDAAREEIVRISGEKGRAADVRPFGWDDICA